ncbi:DUF3231 family protein [Alkalihalobacillus sp. AL-G]|uniref:DUF3231 family protein n=1 Tax=Alkalihalobacillus sp. AL-G TaxID=2926399 RepID=UPI00272B351B|nr:DUF3231 family protein [Alkalihalobacillus sp. AL-G]WLD94422.1 DUF3231 family protein [Alkalihalobacillus sp. AL-G]
MVNSNHIPLSSSELGNLWMAYQELTMKLRFIEYFLEHAEDQEAHQLLQDNYNSTTQIIAEITNIFQQEGAVIPVGFTENDVHTGVPKLFDFSFDVMFLHLISKVETSLNALFSGMSYRLDVNQLFIQLTANAQESNQASTQYLLKKGVLTRPPYVSMPTEVEFVREKKYMTGVNWFQKNRALNTIEISLLHHAIETNLTGLQLMIGFAQVANDNEVKKYFTRGMDLSLKVETKLGEFLRNEYIEPPASPAGKATNSTVSPFSDKIMMYITNLLSSFGLGSNALGGAFSLRSDLPFTMTRIGKDIYDFAKEGGKIMVKNGWMEEPPQVEDRSKLTE